jgi:hypothetical protein
LLGKEWRKSKRSNPSGNCVEAREAGGGAQVRDTKQAGRGPVLSFGPDSWRVFVAGVKTGAFVTSNNES